MAIAIKTIPVLTGDVAERFIERTQKCTKLFFNHYLSLQMYFFNTHCGTI